MKKTARPARPFRLVKKDGNKLVESVVNAYRPDDAFAVKNAEAIVARFYAAVCEKNRGGKYGPERVEAAKIVEVNAFGALRVRSLANSDELRAAIERAKKNAPLLRKIIESGVNLRPASEFKESEIKALRKIAETAKFREDFAVASNTNNASTDPFNEYIPLMGGPFSHQLYLHDYLDMLAKSFEAWNHNPLAHQIVKITTHFVLGRGVTFKARDPKVQEVFADWWDRNDMSGRLEFWSDMLARDGELLIRRFVNPLTKSVFVRWVDPSTIWEIVTDIEDIERVFYYHQQYPTAYQVLYGAGNTPASRRFDPTKFESSKYVINQIPAGEVHHVKINCSPNEKRGRSDLFPILGWLKRYKDFQTAVVLRAIIQATFAWKNKLTGSQTDVDSFISEFGTDQPEFGSVWVENEASNLEPMTADLKGGEGLADCPGIVNAIAVGSGVPKEYLGMTDHGTRATAVVASEPGVKKFQARQLLLGRLLKDIAQIVIVNEVAAGRIQKTADTKIDFQFPEIATEDRSAKLKDIILCQAERYISKKRAATMAAKEMGIEDFDPDNEKSEIEAEGIDDMATLYPGPGVSIPGSGQGGDQEDQPAPSGGLGGAQRRAIKRNDRR